MSGFSKISLGRPTKKYTHNMSFDNNTTFDFGGVQPVLTQYLEGDDTINLNLRQFLRLAPLPYPTFGRVHVQNEFRFVPITDVCPYYEALLAKQPYFGGDNVTYNPEKVPYTCNRTLVQFLCLNFCDFNVLYRDNFESDIYHYASNGVSGVSLDPSDPADLTELNTLLRDFWQGSYDLAGALSSDKFEKLTYDSNEVSDIHGTFGGYKPPMSLPSNPETGNTYSTITLDSADFVIKVSESYIFLFRLNSVGRRLRKIFVGCGFSLSCFDTDKLSILPLLAFYKAYFDTYAPQRDISWISTNCYALIKYIEDHYFLNFVDFLSDSESDALSLFRLFISDLSECWYTQLDDFVSAHRETPVTVNRQVLISDGNEELQDLSNNIDTAGSELPLQYAGASTNWLTIQGLRLVTRFVNKDSVIGGKLSDWIKVIPSTRRALDKP